MNEIVMTCPNCGASIPLSSAMQAHLAEEASRIRTQVEKAAKERAEREAAEQVRVKEEELVKLREKAKEATAKEADLLRKERELGEKEQQQVLAFEKRLTDESARIRGGDGTDAGSILWESKRAQNWGKDWLTKLKDDQSAAGSACAVLASRVLPDGVCQFGQREGMWICDLGHAVPLAAALRIAMSDVSKARRISENRGEKAQLLYDYLTGPDFLNRARGVFEAFDDLQRGLRKERSAMERLWNRREGQLLRATENLAAMFGKVEGISGKHLEGIEALALPSPDEEGDAEDDAPTEQGDPRPEDPQLIEMLFYLIPEDGAAIGNKTLVEQFKQEGLRTMQLGIADTDYARCKESLIEAGRIQRGRGRGGAVSRILKM